MYGKTVTNPLHCLQRAESVGNSVVWGLWADGFWASHLYLSIRPTAQQLLAHLLVTLSSSLVQRGPPAMIVLSVWVRASLEKHRHTLVLTVECRPVQASEAVFVRLVHVCALRWIQGLRVGFRLPGSPLRPEMDSRLENLECGLFFGFGTGPFELNAKVPAPNISNHEDQNLDLNPEINRH